ncbi:MAG: PA2169 family four-helix-bundle protein [Gloeobacteraceae cyanobacterium ES-bin-316]|nr:PA2169 family four-helix-bundle protein [Ferruginibacter sp.]
MQVHQTLFVEKLNHLTAILNDSSEGYLTAATYARTKEQESFFEKLSYQRKDFAREIKKIIRSMGENTYSADGFLSLLHRTWKDMSYQLKSRDKDAVKTCCVIGEKFTSNYYESILADVDLPESVKNLLHEQLSSIHNSLQQFEAVPKGGEFAKPQPDTDSAAVSDGAEKKLAFLISYLHQVAKDFEMIADDLEDKNLKHAFMFLSEENQQFAQELKSQVKNFGLTISEGQLSLLYDNENLEFPGTLPDSRANELVSICDKSEYLFLKLYTDALKEFLSFGKLKDLMIFQYNSIRAGFVKLRTLNSLRFNNDYSHV